MASFSVGGNQQGLAPAEGEFGAFGRRRDGGPIVPGALSGFILGDRARSCCDVDRIPRADARLEAMDELISRGGRRRGNVDVVRRLAGDWPFCS